MRIMSWTACPEEVSAVAQTVNVNPITEHALFLRLFVTNAGGW